MIDYRPDEQAQHNFRWQAALWSGLAVGVLFLFFSKGIPWGSMGLGFAAMGRDIPIHSAPLFFLVNSLVHMILAIGYAYVIGLAVYRLEIVSALIVGAATGIVLFAANYLLFHVFFGLTQQGEFPVATTHFFFGLVTAAAYKALSVRPVEERQTA